MGKGWHGESKRHSKAARKRKRSVYSVGSSKVSRRQKWNYHAKQWQKAKRQGNAAARHYHRKQMVKYARPRYGVYKVKWRKR